MTNLNNGLKLTLGGLAKGSLLTFVGLAGLVKVNTTALTAYLGSFPLQETA